MFLTMKSAIILGVILLPAALFASDFDTTIPAYDKGKIAYYISSSVGKNEKVEFMIDTGAGHSAITETTLNKLRTQVKVEFVKNVAGTLANGAKLALPLYRVASMQIGAECTINDVKVVVLPNATRNIIGMSALKKVAPFALTTNPPRLLLSNCRQQEAA